MKSNKKIIYIPSDQEIQKLLYYYKIEEYDLAEQLAIKMTNMYPKHIFAWKILAAIFTKIGRHKEAYIINKKALKIAPEDPEVHNNLGVKLKSMGKFNDAEKSYKRAIQLNPNFVEAHRNLSSIKKFKTKDEQYLIMNELIINKKITNEQRCHIHFGLAKANQDLGDYKEAFFHFEQANMIRKKILKYDIKQDVEVFNEIKFNYQNIANISLKFENLINNKIPIFIVGMPRSGTTLVEQIISSHPKVIAGGELDFVEELGSELSRGKSKIDSFILANFRSSYLSKLDKYLGSKDFITDKMPINFLHIGLIAKAFPEAKIINVKRSAAAVCWSNYSRYFETRGMSFSFNLKDIIDYYHLYESHMIFWEKYLSNRIYNIDYEKLVVNQEKETRKLIEYIGLDWTDDFLSPEKNDRAVITASNFQVKQSIYQGSSQQWKNYKEFLNDTFDVFKD